MSPERHFNQIKATVLLLSLNLLAKYNETANKRSSHVFLSSDIVDDLEELRIKQNPAKMLFSYKPFCFSGNTDINNVCHVLSSYSLLNVQLVLFRILHVLRSAFFSFSYNFWVFF